MRISSINVAQPRNLNYRMNTKHVQAQPVQVQQPSFKGWKAGLGGLIGTGFGVLVGTVVSGGLLAPLLLGATGTAVGVIGGSSKENNSGDDYDGYTPCYPSSDC